MKISVVMSTYNGKKYIVPQLDSIRTQTVKADEVLIFDDVSTDDTAQIISDYIKKYNLINWKVCVNERNFGWKKNFAQGIARATGDIIFTSDQDDIWLKDKIEIMSTAMSSDNNIQLLIADQVPFQFDNVPNECETKTGTVEKMSLKNHWKYIQRPGCVFCFTKELQAEFVKYWKKNYAHDLLLWQIAALTETLYRIDYNAILFRRHDSNSTPKNSRSLANRLNLSKQSLDELNHLKNCFVGNHAVVRKIENAIEFENLRIRFFEKKNPLIEAIKLLTKANNYLRPMAWGVDVLCKIKSHEEKNYDKSNISK